MKSVRLTNDLKAGIWKQIYNEKFLPEVEQIKIDKLTFADKCYYELFNKTERQTMKLSPAGAFGFHNEFKMHFGGQSICLHLTEKRPFFYDYSNKNKLGVDHQLTIEFLGLNDWETKNAEARKIAKQYTFAIMNSCTTTNKLLEVWPECKKYLEQAIGQPIANNLPAVVTTELNKMLGL